MTVFYSLIWNYLLMWPTISFFNDVSIIWIGRLTKMMFSNKKNVENKKNLIIHSNDECRNLVLLMQISSMLQWKQVEFTLNFSQTNLKKKRKKIKVSTTWNRTFKRHSIIPLEK